MKYRLRAANESDREWLRWLHHATMRDAVDSMWGWDEKHQDTLFDSGFSPPNQQIIQVEARDVGVIAVTRRPSELFLDNIQIVPDCQGQGLGTALISDLQGQARDEGIPVGLRVIVSNRARMLYGRLGFVVTGQSDTHYYLHWSADSHPDNRPRMHA
ncbi:MAG: GNAT family N-acetyltransferase [Chloroflexota bacterium]|nr:GNAT family N-acetyltransferase [Chloroflexota bacterium]